MRNTCDYFICILFDDFNRRDWQHWRRSDVRESLESCLLSGQECSGQHPPLPWLERRELTDHNTEYTQTVRLSAYHGHRRPDLSPTNIIMADYKHRLKPTQSTLATPTQCRERFIIFFQEKVFTTYGLSRPQIQIINTASQTTDHTNIVYSNACCMVTIYL